MAAWTSARRGGSPTISRCARSAGSTPPHIGRSRRRLRDARRRQTPSPSRGSKHLGNNLPESGAIRLSDSPSAQVHGLVGGVMKCAECGCEVKRGTVVGHCGNPECCCKDLPTKESGTS